ncbi:MAG: ASKHA domain-containing protein [Thermoplasmata archaeon]|nr:ASKHA domain-containing protein [Thermoplasmata archaeon]
MADKITRFQPSGSRTVSRVDAFVLDLAREAGVSIESICGGSGRCGKCKVAITAGEQRLSRMNDNERMSLSEEEMETGLRLACQAQVVSEGDITIDVPEGSRRGLHRLLASGIEPAIPLSPAISKVLLKIPPATLKDIRADDDRLLEMLNAEAAVMANIAPGIHQRIPNALREKSWVATVTLYRKEELIGIDPGDTTKEILGVAVDVGTTKVVAYLLDLVTGDTIGTESKPNPQIPFGEDVMSRITYAMTNDDGLAKLQQAVIGAVNALIRQLCDNVGKSPIDILELIMVGNTAMHHMFFGIPPIHLASAPYAPAVRKSISVEPNHLGIDIYPFGKVGSLPNIAGFVGADAVAVLLSSGLYDDDKIGMMIDIGTNTEIIAGSRDGLISCSCASGPAFEGAHIKHGMRAATGAIERVWMDASEKDVRVRTVDDVPPRGICGSGIVDAVSEMFRCGIISASGKINSSSEWPGRIREGPDGKLEFVLVAQEGKGEGERDVSVTQHDVQEIQLAKAAIFTGVSTLLRKLGLRSSDLSCIYAAGAFGTYVDASSAISIGMYPDIPPERIRFVGNAAGSGARMALKSVEARRLADELSRKVEYIELASEEDFQSEFAKAMFLPHRELDRFPTVARAIGQAADR